MCVCLKLLHMFNKQGPILHSYIDLCQKLKYGFKAFFSSLDIKILSTLSV